MSNDRGHYGNRSSRRGWTAQVGVEWTHLLDNPVEQLNTTIVTAAREVVQAAGGDPALVQATAGGELAMWKDPKVLDKVIASRDAIDRSPYRDLWDNVVSPLFTEWTRFYQSRRHWYDVVTSMTTAWETYQAWFDRAKDMLAKVQAAGLGRNIPPPHPLPTSVVDEAHQAIKKGTADAWKVVKYGAWGVLGIGAIIALSSVASNLRSGRDPAESYLRPLRKRSSGLGRLALPAAETAELAEIVG